MHNGIYSYNIGIIGGGHLGRSLAKALLHRNTCLTTLKISCSGNRATLQQLVQEGLADFISTNAIIAAGCDIVFIAIRPADIPALKGIKFGINASVISCMAGCGISPLEKILQHKIIRIMPSSPITIDEGKAVCAWYPQNKRIKELLTEAMFTVYPLAGEHLFNIFTACVCLPAAFLQVQIEDIHFSEADVIAHFRPQFDEFEKMFQWAFALTPFYIPLPDKLAYINRMATRGGITEAIINSLKNGDGFIEAIQSGIERGAEISKVLAD